MAPSSFISPQKRGFPPLFLRMNTIEGKITQDDPLSPDIPIRKPDSTIPNIEDDREPIDEPYLPEDPGDVPEELRIYREVRKHFGEVVTVTYKYRDFIAHTTGTLAASFTKLHVLHESRHIRIRLENVISIVFKDGSWIRRK